MQAHGSAGRLILGVALCMSFAACGDDDPGGGATTATPQYETAACEVAPPTGQDAARMQCGFLTVPENRHLRGGRTIKLAVVVLRSTAAHPQPDPFVHLSGGPGGWAIDGELGLYTADFAAPIQSKRDIVIFDQRGTGHSQPALNCPEVIPGRDSLAELLTPEQEEARDQGNLLACRDRLVREGNDLAGYSSAATAQDIADLMTALGYEHFNLYGLSYGTRVALTTLRDVPNVRIRSVVLDSTVPLQTNPDGGNAGPPAVERSLNLLFADCAANAACNTIYPHLEQTFYELIARLNGTPLMLQPTAPDGQPFHVVATGDRLLRLTGLALASTSFSPSLPYFIAATARGNRSVLTAALSAVGGPDLYSPGMQAAVLCNEEMPFVTPETLDMLNHDVNPVIVQAYSGEPYPQVCRAWGGPAADPIENQAVHSNVPALILAGGYDTATPPAYGQLAAQTLPHSYFFQFRGFGHVILQQQESSASAPSCAMRVMTQFLDDPTHTPDGSCVAAIPPPHFLGT